jgi:hypothetical protein
MKHAIFAAISTIAIVASAGAATARPHTPHHTSAGVAHRHHGHGYHHHHHGTSKAERMHRRANTHHYGNPNARNPSQEGYQQQLGNTTNGPRY